jgi:hypothetical protein
MSSNKSISQDIKIDKNLENAKSKLSQSIIRLESAVKKINDKAHLNGTGGPAGNLSASMQNRFGQVLEENKQLKARLNSKTHSYNELRELVSSTILGTIDDTIEILEIISLETGDDSEDS